MSLYEELWELWVPCQKPYAVDALFAFRTACEAKGLSVESVLVTTHDNTSISAVAWLVGGVMYFPFEK